MGVALREAARIARPGASLCFTHFIEANGEPRGTIHAPIAKQDLMEVARAAGLIDIRFHPMRHQGDRYMLTCRTPRPRQLDSGEAAPDSPRGRAAERTLGARAELSEHRGRPRTALSAAG